MFLPEDSKLGRLGFDGGGEILLDAEGPDSPETFSGDTIDVGALAEEFFGLAIDPYPRKPGVSLAAAGDARAATQADRSAAGKAALAAAQDLNSVDPAAEIAVVRRPKTAIFAATFAEPRSPGRQRDDCRVIRISIDAMGGDHGPAVVMPGAGERCSSAGLTCAS